MKIKSSPSILSLALTASLLGSAAWSTGSHACSADSPYMGSICITAATYCPRGYAEANGTVLQASQYAALFSLLSNTYGGDGRTTFALPDLRGRVPVHIGQGTGLSNIRLGDKRGVEALNLNIAQLPMHNHDAAFTPVTGQQPVTLPAQPGSGAITATAATDVVPGNAGVDPAPSVSNYYLTGVTSSAAGPVTTTAPGTNKSTLIGTHVTVDTSTYKPAIAEQTVNITAVKGGAVAVANAGASAAVPTLPPELGLRFCIATEGLYPPRPD